MPHESTFSRAFDEFAGSELSTRWHAAIIDKTQKDRIIGHISRDSTAIEARERYPDVPQPSPKKKRYKRDRSRSATQHARRAATSKSSA